MYFDIHSHILPGVDDGAKDFEESVKLLKIMKKNGITAVMATSHFYPDITNLEDYLEVTNEVFNKLLEKIKGKNLPKVYLGSEMLYYKGLGNCEILRSVTLNGSKYLLLELAAGDISKQLFEDITALKEQGIIPIIAHVERYAEDRNFKKLITFLRKNDIPVQINAVSFLIKPLKKFIKLILKSEIFCVIGTDSHSVFERPPFLKEAFEVLQRDYPKGYFDILMKNNFKLYDEIIGDKGEK